MEKKDPALGEDSNSEPFRVFRPIGEYGACFPDPGVGVALKNERGEGGYATGFR